MPLNQTEKAGNIGDVWKHYALARILSVPDLRGYSYYVETHAGNGVYELKLKNRDEWGKGIASVASRQEFAAEPFQSILTEFNPKLEFPGKYPGSSVIADRLLSGVQLILFDCNPVAANDLKKHLPHASVRRKGGYEGLIQWNQEERRGDKALIFIDPWYDQSDWKNIPKCLRTLGTSLKDLIVIIWYPVNFTYSTPNQLRRECAELEAGFAVECIVDHPSHSKQFQRLRGSGLLLLGDINAGLCGNLTRLSHQLSEAMKLHGQEPDPSRQFQFGNSKILKGLEA